MTECVDYGSAALNKVYGGMGCQNLSHELPFTGLDAMVLVVVGLLLLSAGILLKMRSGNEA